MAEYMILYVDDDPATFLMGKALGDKFTLIECADENTYRSKVTASAPVLHGAVVDYRLDKGFPSYKDGLEITRELRQRYPNIGVVAFSAFLSPGGQLERILEWQVAGANYFWERGRNPWADEIVAPVRQVLRFGAQQVERWNNLLAGEIDPRAYQDLSRALGQFERIASLPSPVLILGETGTGKESVAKALHKLSSRRDMPYVAVNCAAIPAHLIESELFGHEKGAFTDANSKKEGKFEAAHRGTIFLDEVGELPLEQQAKLLRVLQERKIERLGSVKSIEVDVRILSATHRNLATMVSDGHFRSDLYYRLNVFPVFVPPLRKRVNDFPTILRTLVDRWNVRYGTSVELDENVIDYLKPSDARPYLGNIRELENWIQRILGLVTSRRPTVEDVKAIESIYVSPAINELVSENVSERQQVRGRDQYVDLMSEALETLLPRIGKSVELTSEASVVRAAREQVLRSYVADEYPDTPSHIMKLVEERHPNVAKIVRDAMKQYKAMRRIAKAV
jgi:DNA-binding NtrC family response regulator